MHTRLYQSWQLDGNRLTLTGKSMGNGNSSLFTATSTIAVSYTHLDVYKRQGIPETLTEETLKMRCTALDTAPPVGIMTVSYTHLAVRMPGTSSARLLL